jgi:acyl-CoA dehydrogenase
LAAAASVGDHADMAAPVIARLGTEAQKQRFLPDIAAGPACAWVCRHRTRWRLRSHADEDHRHPPRRSLDPERTENIHHQCTVGRSLITVARSDPDSRGAQGFSIFVIEKGGKGFTTGRKFEKTGWLASDMSELFFDDFAVPADNMLEGKARGFYLLMQGLERERMSLCAQCVGMMERALTITLSHAKARAAYGRTRWDLQSIRHELAGYASELSCRQAAAAPLGRKEGQGRKRRGWRPR